MTTLKETLVAERTSKMKTRDAWSTQVMRNVIGAIEIAEKEKRNGADLTEAEVTAVVSKLAKRYESNAEGYDQTGHEERAAAERAEATYIRSFLPAQLTQEDITAVVKEVIAETGVTEMSQMSQVMKKVMAREGMNLYGKEVSAAVRAQLA